MPIVTDIKVKPKNQELASLFCDGEFCTVVQTEILVKFGVKIGTNLSQSTLNEILKDSGVKSCFEFALKYVSARLKTEYEVKKHLKEKEYLPEAINNAIAKLKEYKYINDEYYANVYIDINKSRMGYKKIAYNLTRHGVNSNIVNEALENLGDQQEVILITIKKYMKAKVYDYKTKDKLYRFLVGRGFKHTQIMSVFNDINFKNGDNDENWDWYYWNK